jgi:membrane protease YdiL (CAAX protease family)
VDQTEQQGSMSVTPATPPPLPPVVDVSVDVPSAAQVSAPVPPQQPPSAAPQAAQPERIPLRRALGEIGAVYFVAFGLGVISAVGLLTNPSLGGNQQIHNWLEAGSEMLQYVMQASTVVFGVGYFSLRRGVTLRSIFGRFSKPSPPVAYYQPPPPYAGQAQYTPNQYQPQPQQEYPPQYSDRAPYPDPSQYPYPSQTQLYAPPYSAPPNPGYPVYAPYPQMGYLPSRPGERGSGWQFARAFFLSMAGVLGFLLAVVVYVNVTGQSTGAPDQGNSLWMVPVGLVVALSAGFGEEVLITGMVVTTLEQAGFAKRAWVIYLVAIALRVPFHLYYGWASLAVICFTVVNVWVYRRWRLLWPIVLAHATYDAIEFAGSLSPGLAGLTLLALGLGTFVMVIVIACVELSDRSARRRFNQWRAAVGV